MNKRRQFLASMVLAMLPTGGLSRRSHAQSEFLRGSRMPYDAFDKLAKTDIEVPQGVIHVGFAPGDVALPREKILDWVRKSANAVSVYYGRFPVKSVRLLLVPVDGAGVRGGTTWGYRGAAIRVPLGRDTNEDNLLRDWVLVHEMVHTALPDLCHR